MHFVKFLNGSWLALERTSAVFFKPRRSCGAFEHSGEAGEVLLQEALEALPVRAMLVVVPGKLEAFLPGWGLVQLGCLV